MTLTCDDATQPGDREPALPVSVPSARPLPEDEGSVTPLVIGMMVCLLLLTAGVTAAGSAFLAGQRLQRLCDGAVAAAAGSLDPRRSSAESVAVSDPIAAANQYLQVRGADVGAVVSVGATTVSARCSNDAPITFGALFGSPTLARTVTSTSQPVLRQNAAARLPVDHLHNADPAAGEGGLA